MKANRVWPIGRAGAEHTLSGIRGVSTRVDDLHVAPGAIQPRQHDDILADLQIAERGKRSSKIIQASGDPSSPCLGALRPIDERRLDPTDRLQLVTLIAHGILPSRGWPGLFLLSWLERRRTWRAAESAVRSRTARWHVRSSRRSGRSRTASAATRRQLQDAATAASAKSRFGCSPVTCRCRLRELHDEPVFGGSSGSARPGDPGAAVRAGRRRGRAGGRSRRSIRRGAAVRRRRSRSCAGRRIDSSIDSTRALAPPCCGPSSAARPAITTA